jgi:hypothetical protein
MTQGRKSSRVLGWTALALLVAAVGTFVIPIAFFVMAASNDGLKVGDDPKTVETSGNRTWGIYFDDRDNTGYSESCSITDGEGGPVEIRDPGPTVSSSDTEMLDHVFTTPADGKFTVECNATSATVRVGPVGNLSSVLIGVAVAGALGLAGLVIGVVWLTRRTSVSLPSQAA